MAASEFFQSPKSAAQKQYEALRAFYMEKKSATEVAEMFGYSKATVYSLTRDFKKRLLSEDANTANFFNEPSRGCRPSPDHDDLREFIILLRKKYLSVPDIKSILDAQNKSISERHIYNILHAEGFARLPRRTKAQKSSSVPQDVISAPKSQLLTMDPGEFSSQDVGILLFLPYIKTYGIDKIIEQSDFPETKQLPKLNSILAFIGLKLLNIRRYTSDDLWCMDRGPGFFAGLNVLPKAGWFTSYSSRITRDMNLSFLKAMHALWKEHEFLSDTANLDFVTLPYWGEEEHLENNWSGTRNQALNSILAAIAQDPDTGFITYGDTNVRHNNESNVAIEFLDFYKDAGGDNLKYLVFDSKFTTYENLSKLDDNDVKFVTIRRRGKKIVEELGVLCETPPKVPVADCRQWRSSNLSSLALKTFGVIWGVICEKVPLGESKICHLMYYF